MKKKRKRKSGHDNSNQVQQCFSLENQATLWHTLPLIKELQTRWEKKHDRAKNYEQFSIYKATIQDGLDKLHKYYCKFDEKPAYVLTLVLHPYYKLDYVELAWGGEKEQEKEQLLGNLDMRNWKDEALTIFEMMAEEYWRSHPKTTMPNDSDDVASPTKPNASLG
ncbi:hypothetical protein EDB83DRAFT_2323718 [Lactarius deliciosus]|nr:hypothetical protein EDB83DRAFT_2323718 [Lactarius deliciosus]